VTRPTVSWLPAGLFIAHFFALIFGLIGLLIMLPHPDLWTGDPNAVKVFDFSMKYAGSLHIIFGAATMLAAGVLTLGWRKTAIFFVAAYSLSLSAELIGTGTGWPFGNYAYTSFLGHKVLGRVPFTIPLSWFYMGLAAYLLGSALAARLDARHRTAWSLALGVWFLTVWDLVLDPAMAHPSLRVQFWHWDQGGAYFGMPARNLIGWSLTGLLFMAVSRALWRRDADLADRSMRIPLAVYVVNVAFAMVLSAGVGLWLPILLAGGLGLLPAALAARRSSLPQLRRLRWAQDV
jgi:carotene biosynthesis associated membrane protein